MRYWLVWMVMTGIGTGAEVSALEQRVLIARKTVEAGSGGADAYKQLATLLVRRARESGKPEYCEEASRAAEESLRREPGEFEGRKAMVLARLCGQRWREALSEAAALNKQTPDDVPMWGYLADAQMAMGMYDAALRSVQRMVDLRQVNPQALQRGARLREIFGYPEMAIDWYSSALSLTGPGDVEERAWLLTQIARVQRVFGKNDAAEKSAREALAVEADYPWALDELVRCAMTRREFAKAVEIAEKRQTVAPSEANLYQMGAALSESGRAGEARAVFAKFEGMADAASPERVLYLARYAGKPVQAAQAAQASLQQRNDPQMRAAYAYALALQQEWAKAVEQMSEALETGVKNPEWLLAAGTWAQASGDTALAKKYFRKVIEAAPASAAGDRAIEALAKP